MSNLGPYPRAFQRATGCLLLAVALGIAGAPSSSAAAEATRPKKVVFLAGTVHQGPGGHPPGTHEYELSARLLKHDLETAQNVAGVKAEIHWDGWPRDPAALDDADTIVVLSDGADRNPLDHPLLVGDRLQILKKHMDRGCGLVAIHWSVFVPRGRGGEEFLEWIGGYFDFESGSGPNKWHSKIQTAATSPRPATPAHPISRGLAPFKLREEYYYNLRFRPDDPRFVPILSTSIPGEAQEQVVAWAVERGGGGRGFGFTGGHFFDNWAVDEFRRMVLNAILWTAQVEVPAGGVRSAPPKSEPPVAPGDPPIQAAIVTGHQHPAHAWRETTVALQEALSQDRRFQITTVTDPEFLATKNLAGVDVVVLNYCNWQRAGLSDAAKTNFQKFLTDGGGLVIIHFANGAFHASLPETPASDWPEYRKLCRRVWDHAPGRSSHDPYGRFTVHVTRDHPITGGLNSFETIDELYCNQQGDEPIEVLATAHSTITHRDEPMAFVYPYGKGRVFQTVLGHAAESIRAPGETTLIRRAAVWAAGREQRSIAPRPQPVSSATPKLMPQGRFGAALDPRGGASRAARKEIYDARPLTVECWARLDGKTGFNILVANSAKESADHWELYTYAGSGELSLYLPGCAPAEIRSGVDVTDGKWHYLAASFDDEQARLYVDGKLVKQQSLRRERRGGPTAPLYFGGYPPQRIGCDGLIDEVRISRRARALDPAPSAPLAVDADTIGLWHFDRTEAGALEDASSHKNPAVADAVAPLPGPLLTRQVAQAGLKLVAIDTSPDESFFSLRVDTTGRLFVGGREALFVYEPDPRGGYQSRQLLYRFGPDTWITDVLVRGDDLYVMTNAALYLFAGGRVERQNLKPRRLLWGTPVDLHVTWHGLAWGPEGDLYFSSGDPLLNYGDFQNRPDHWGHWTIHAQPEGTNVPYTGQGGFFRCRPDGSQLRVVAGGTRGAVGIAFDRRWNLFSNDNDHESIADRYSPARLLHVAPRAHFFWPRGWIAAMSPERSDLLEIVNAGLGREAPVGQAYYDEPWLGPQYRDSLLVARWGQRKLDGFSLAPRGASFQAAEFPLLSGAETARPVGVTVGRGGRVFAALSYMAANEWSPKYPSELVMITRADDPPTAPFESYDAPSAPRERLWAELSQPACSRRQQAHVEILRRGGDLLDEAVARLAAVDPSDPALMHLPWLAAASGKPQARTALVALVSHEHPDVRAQAIRALAEFRSLEAPADVFARALADTNLRVQHAAVVALFDRGEPLSGQFFAGPARSQDTYLRQTSAFLLAERATTAELDRLLGSADSSDRLAGVLAAGFRLTVPPAVGEVPTELPLRYESQNALFVIPYADATVDLKALGRVGSFTFAERWKAVKPSDAERRLFDALVARLRDDDEHVSQQAGYFLSLLDDPATQRLVAESRRTLALNRLSYVPPSPIAEAWTIGPFDDGEGGWSTIHPPERGAIDLSAPLNSAGKKLEWRQVEGQKGFALSDPTVADSKASSYLYFRLQSLQGVRAALAVATEEAVKLWHNAREVEGPSPFVVTLEPGSNDILLRVAHGAGARPVAVDFRAGGRVEAMLPEKLGLGTLAERLRNAGAGDGNSASAGVTAVPQEFLEVDWTSAAQTGDPKRGRQLFGADALGCVKCHAVLPNQKGGGGPSLAGALGRFTVSHVVESILLPNKQVAPVFATTLVATADGKTLSGLVIEEDDRQVVLLLPTALRQAVPKSQIEERSLRPISPMPAGLVKTPEELRDLLAYLLGPNPQAP